VTGFDCIDSGTNNACKISKVSFAPLVKGPNNTPNGGTSAEDVGWDDLYLKVSTDSSGKVISMEGYPVQEYQVFATPTYCGSDPGATFNCNSWLAEHFDAQGVVADNDGPVNVFTGASATIPVLANDRGFVDPVTVTIVTPPTKGSVVVNGLINGGPGPASGISVTYSAAANATVGPDNFVYKVDDGTRSDQATVKINVRLPGAVDDSATTKPNTPININVAANDLVVGQNATVTIDQTSFRYNGDDLSQPIPPAHGTATVTAGNGGAPSGIVVTYAPSANSPPGPGGSLPYTETFTYTLDDGTSPPSTATVAVRLNLLADARDGTITISTQGQEPVVGINGLTGTFAAPGAGGSLGNAGGTSAVTVLVAGNRGKTTVKDNEITYEITDPGFYHGTDRFTYQITDADGDTSSATVTVTIPDEAPSITLPNIAVDENHYSTSLALPFVVTYGNGARDSQHPVTITLPARHGTCAVNPQNGTGTFVYTPDPGYVGSDTCRITMTDVDGQQGSASADITVNPVITVTPKIGGASVDPLTLAFLGALPLVGWRRNHARRAPRSPLGLQMAAVATLVGASLGAFGQTAPDSPEAKQEQKQSVVTLNEIVVTARKVEEKLKDVPLSITAFDSETISAAGIASLGDVADMTPGLSFFNAFGENLPVPVIRGVVPTDIFGQNNAALFVDGVYVAGREGLNFDLVDVERIEVLKGPQSAQYGRNAFSGAINYVSKRPSEELSASLNGEVGSAGKLKGTFLLSGPLLGEKLRGTLAGLYDDFNGTYSNAIPGGNDIGGYVKRAYVARLYYKPVDTLEANLSYYLSADHIDDPNIVSLPTNCEDVVQPPAGIPHVDGLPDINPTPGVRQANVCGRIPGIRSVPGLNGGNSIPKVKNAVGETRLLQRLSLRVDWDWQDIGRFSSLSGFSYTRESSVSDFGRSLGYNQPFLYCSPASVETPGNPNNCLRPDGSFSPADKVFFAGTYNIQYGARTSEFSQELRFTSPTEKPFRYSGGLYWYKSQVLNRGGAPLLTNGPPAIGPDGLPITSYGLPPIDASAPNFGIGTAIFYGSLTPDGGIDPLKRVSEKDVTQGWAVFTGLEFDITDRLTLRGEARLNQEHQQNRALNYTPCVDKSLASQAACGDDFYNLAFADPIYLDAGGGCTGLDGNAYATGRCSRIVGAHYQLITGGVNLKFKLTDDWMTYASVAYGEKPGGIRLVGANVVCPDPSGPQPKGCPSPDGTFPVVRPNPFKIESIISYEVGLKGVGVVLDRQVGVDLAVFYNDWKDIVLRQLRDVDQETGLGYSQPTGFNVNAGSAHVIGAEANMQVAFTDELSGNLTFGWTDAKIQNARQDTYARFPSFRADCGPQPAPGDPALGKDEPLRKWWNNCNQISGDVSGNTLLRQPEFKASASLSYRHNLFGDWDVTGRLDGNYQSSVYVGNENEAWLPAHAYVNAKVGLKSPKYSVQFWVRNLLDNGNAVAAFRDIYWANTNNLYPPYTNQGPRSNFNSFVPLRFSVSYPTERTVGINIEEKFGAAVR
jgi:outer membrane receptor protein involved in Fe transport